MTNGKVPDTGSTFGNRALPPRRQPERIEVQVEVPIGVPFLYDEGIDGYWLGGFGITEYGIWIREDVDQNEWINASEALRRAEKGSDWGKADMARFAVEMADADRALVAQLLGFKNVKSVDIYIAVSSAAQDREIRVLAPSFSHFRLVMGMTSDLQRQWLENARSQKWSVSILRKKLDEAAGVVQQPSKVGKKRAAALLANHKKQTTAVFEQAKKLPDEQRHEMVDHLRDLADRLEQTR